MKTKNLPIVHGVGLVAIFAALGAALVAPGLSAPRADEGGLSVLGDAMQEEGGAAQALSERISYSPGYGRWFKDYLCGDLVAAQKEWKGILKQLAGVEDLRPLMRLTNSRLAFADQPPGSSEDRMNLESCDKTILASTIRELGADNLMVLSAQWFVSSLNGRAKNEESTGIVYCKARAKAHEKAWGPQDPRLMNEYALMAKIYADGLGNYKQASLCASKVVLLAQKNKNSVTEQQAVKFRERMNRLLASPASKKK